MQAFNKKTIERKVKQLKIGRNDKCWCGSGKKYKQCHQAFDDRMMQIANQGHLIPDREMIKNADQIAGIRQSAKINIAVLDYVAEHIHVGISTEEIDRMVYDLTTKMGGSRLHCTIRDIRKAYALL